LAVPPGIIATIVSKCDKGETADYLRPIGGKAIDLVNWVVGVDAKYQLAHKAVEGLDSTLGPETIREPYGKIRVA
jgi:hypothetical protein